MTYREVAPILEKVKKYFGTNHYGLNSWAGTMLPDWEVDMEIHISKEEIHELFVKHFKTEPVDDVCDILWLNANAGYDRSYEKRKEEIIEHYENDADVRNWDCIEKDLLNLYALLNKHPEGQPVKVTVGDDTVELDNTLNWFPAFFKKHCFSKVIPNVTSVEQAQEMIDEMKRSVGHPTDRWLENSIVYGVYNIAKDYNLIKCRTPKSLKMFIWDYLRLMRAYNLNDPRINDNWIKTRISQLCQKALSEVVLRSSSSELIDPGNNPIFWEEDKLCYLIDPDDEPAS